MASSNISSGWSLWRQTLSAYKLHFWRYTGLVLLVIVPTSVLSATTSGDATIAAYGSLASLIMNVALIYVVILYGNTPDSKITFRTLFYDSSAVLIRYLVVGFLLAIMLIPAALGLGLLNFGSPNVPPLGEIILLAIIALIAASPSIYLLIRNGLAAITVYGDNRRPLEALRRSRQLTQGRFWVILGRYLILGLGIILAALPISFVCIGLFLLTHVQFFISLYSVINAAIILPLLYIYLFNLHQALVAMPVQGDKTKAK